MSDHAPGSTLWWIETAAVVGGGIALAISLWDGPIFSAPPTPVAVTEPELRTLGNLLDAGCLTQEHLQAMRDGQPMQIDCPVAQPSGPPTDRLFP